MTNTIMTACQKAGIDLRDLLPIIAGGILEKGVCSCRDAGELCPVCSAARSLDDLSRAA